MGLLSKKQQPDAPRRRQQVNAKQQERADDESLRQRYAFKRNRTLTGSASSQVVSASESNTQIKSARVQAHDLAAHRHRLSWVLLFVTLCATILFIIIFQFTARPVVQTTEVSVKLDTTYTEVIEEYLSRQPIERLRFMLQEDALNQYVRAALPEVVSVHSRGFAGLGSSLFVIQMRQPVAGWSIRGSQHYVDASGVSFTKNYFTAPKVQITDNSGIQVEAGKAVASNQFLGFVGRIVGLASNNKYTVTDVIIPQQTTRQVELRLKGIDFPIKLSIDRSAGEQVEDMSRALRWLESKGKTPEYLDVRVSGRAFYR